MRREHLQHLVCTDCKATLQLRAESETEGRVETGTLSCTSCGAAYPIKRFIPRFVSTDKENYTGAFGLQWNLHFRTQYDGASGASVSADRYFKETRWGHHLTGQLVLEAGCGSGRFTEHAVSTGAMVISFDYSDAVEASYRSNGHFDNLLIVQASIFKMPFRCEYFDKVFCIGVIQHTPDPEAAFRCLVESLKPAGNIVVDAYRVFPFWKQVFLTKYWVRPLTKRIPAPVLYRLCTQWVNFWWGITGLAWRLTGRRALSWFLLIADYRGVYPIDEAMQKEWAVLDTFDMLSPAYDYPQTLESVTSWFQNAGLKGIEVGYGYNGIEGRGSKA